MSTFNWSHAAERYWPRRLLHVDNDTLTSLEKSGECTYGNFHAPSYNILSYTWGRWEVPHGPALPIQNITWKVPPIQPRAFTAEAFAKVVRRVGRGCRFIWLDVACIDQEEYSVKMNEIGHQAAIFRGAQEAYIWLHEAPRAALHEFISGTHDAELYSDEWLERRTHRLGQIFDDPWFSSTWTLQEAFLRTKAILLFSDADTLEVSSDDGDTKPCRLQNILNACNTNNQALQFEVTYCRHILTSTRVSLIETMLQKMESAGVMCLYENNAIRLYAASTNRTARDKHDRIYGIMQVFGFVLGEAQARESQTPNHNFTLHDLEDQMGEALNSTSATVAQMFVHMEDSRPLRSWCIEQGIRIPIRVYNISEPQDLCRISFDPIDGIAKFQGLRAPFDGWLKLCHEISRNKSADIEGPIPWVQLDRTTRNKSKFSGAMRTALNVWHGVPEDTHQLLLTEYGSQLCVFTIGLWNDVEGIETVKKFAGILCFPKTEHNRVYWVRVGICIWKMSTGEEERSRHLFSTCELIMG